MTRSPIPQKKGSAFARRSAQLVAVGVVAAVALTGCAKSSGGSGSGDSGTLNMGAVFPQTGTLSFMAPTLTAGFELAADDINKADAGITVNTEVKDEGDSTTDTALTAAKSLIEKDSVIIGAASSAASKNIIPTVTKRQVVEISPSNTSPDFTTIDDNGGYYWRTAPSDLLQGKSLGGQIIKDGAKKVSIIYQNDTYGSGLKDAVKNAVEAGGATVEEVSFDPAAKDISSETQKAIADDPDALVAISFDQFKGMVQTLQTAGFDFSKLYGTDGNNGIMKEGDISIKGATFSQPGPYEGLDDFLNRVKEKAGQDLTSTVYAPEVYDATIVAALAALQGGATDGTTIKDNLQSVSADGTKCTSFEECAKLVKDGTDIDYDGFSGPIDFDDNGDVTKATISFYKVSDASNKTSFERQEEVTAD
ncbi:ABC transporter substrate-binding protein [Pseudoclavibacter caeni]|uniref:ABC transporter substrate-binding protein n=1 Tax=Pseudoclavibacter caeni TaxID=908846 RepID=A0A7C8BQ30_9MICO|nr:ABC transporter substrate-binding protein [Pseudoclavibacter caeni]KAB1632465.1 ABC transporter substrate-binding protein [Pseudoclavibacter caeni]NYJ97722.1 branched-chain amino acid transport system substrate-binding protein [Pseudoclavibacter caeni]